MQSFGPLAFQMPMRQPALQTFFSWKLSDLRWTKGGAQGMKFLALLAALLDQFHICSDGKSQRPTHGSNRLGHCRCGCDATGTCRFCGDSGLHQKRLLLDYEFAAGQVHG
jgi:hypothetical protein